MMTYIRAWMSLKIRPDPTTYHSVSGPEASEKLIFSFFLALYSGSQVSIVALWATCFIIQIVFDWAIHRD